MKKSGDVTSKVVKKVGVQYGKNSSSTNVINPASADQMGQAVAFRKEPLVMGTAAQVPLGNRIAGNVGKGGPGTGRTLYGQGGTQSRTPAPAPVGPTRDTMAEFGPEISGPSRRR